MFRITVVQTTRQTRTARGEYQVIGERLVTQEEIDKANYVGSRVFEGTPIPMIKEYGYLQDREITEDIEVKVYEQTVDTFDLKRVIAAVNNETR